jgi:protein-arginine kinase activator protein McsA
MRCTMCGGHATLDQTVFQGPTPIRVRLCEACAQKANANDHLAKIKAAHDKATKAAAVDQFLKVIGKT